MLAIRFHFPLTLQQSGAIPGECKQPRDAAFFWLFSKDLSSDEVLQMFSPPWSNWVVGIYGSNTKVVPKCLPSVRRMFFLRQTFSITTAAPLCTCGQISVGVTGIGDEADLMTLRKLAASGDQNRPAIGKLTIVQWR